jgi:hypothetical protein
MTKYELIEIISDLSDRLELLESELYAEELDYIYEDLSIHNPYTQLNAIKGGKRMSDLIDKHYNKMDRVNEILRKNRKLLKPYRDRTVNSMEERKSKEIDNRTLAHISKYSPNYYKNKRGLLAKQEYLKNKLGDSLSNQESSGKLKKVARYL